MRPLLLLILPLAVHAQSLNNINVERFTVLDAENVSWEQGELGASFSLTSSNHSVGLWVFGATLPEVQAVDKSFVATVEYLDGLTTQYGRKHLASSRSLPQHS